MRFYNFIKEEKEPDIVKKALAIGEPEVGEDYTDDEKRSNIDTIQKALDAASGDDDTEADISIIKDLKDKKVKWLKVKSGTKPTKTKTELPVDPTGKTKEQPKPKPN
jgi:hypothetical protein